MRLTSNSPSTSSRSRLTASATLSRRPIAHSRTPTSTLLFALCIVLCFCGMPATVQALPPTTTVRGKVDVGHSFAPPYERQVPHWNVGAGATINSTYLRLTPAKQSRTGYIWSAYPVTLASWEVEMEFSVTGQRYLGGDGFAFWFVEKPEMIGSVYGSTDFWTGLGIFFDTFNNDNIGQNPLISAIYNDGTQKFDAHSDGASQALATCSFDFRNLPNSAWARIRYVSNELSVYISIAQSNEPDYQHCLTVSDLELGVDKYFGITAHTGEVADNHDVSSFLTIDLTPTDADLRKIRAHYQETLERQHESPSHQAMSTSEFQHSVLTMLSQMQGEINSIQLSELSLSDFLLGGENYGYSAGVRPGGTAPAYNSPSDGGATISNLGGIPGQISALTSLLDAQHQQISSIGDQQSNVLREVRTLQQTVNHLSTQPTSNQPASSQVGNAASDSVALRQIIETMTTTSRRIDELSQALSRLKEDTSRIATQTSNLGRLEGGQFGWVPFLLLAFVTISISILTVHTFQQHMKNQRYKMI